LGYSNVMKLTFYFPCAEKEGDKDFSKVSVQK
jgi:hypothetical protein